MWALSFRRCPLALPKPNKRRSVQACRRAGLQAQASWFGASAKYVQALSLSMSPSLSSRISSGEGSAHSLASHAHHRDVEPAHEHSTCHATCYRAAQTTLMPRCSAGAQFCPTPLQSWRGAHQRIVYCHRDCQTAVGRRVLPTGSWQVLICPSIACWRPSQMLGNRV